MKLDLVKAFKAIRGFIKCPTCRGKRYRRNTWNYTGKHYYTRCPKCGHVLVSRSGYATDVGGVSDGACASCGRETDFVWCD